MTTRTRPDLAAALAAVVLATTLGCPAGAQTIPEGQSCGGLVCDLGIIGHKTEPAPPPAAAPAAVPRPTAEAAPRVRAPRPRKRVATKPVETKPVETKRVDAKPAGAKPVEAPQTAVARPTPIPAAAPPVAARRARPEPALTIAPPSEPAVAVQMPEPKPVRKGPVFYFQSVDPTLQQ